MKSVLILSIGCAEKPWDVMRQTSADTWDSIEVPGVETVFYYGNPVKPNTEKEIYFPIREGYDTLGQKLLCALEWALENKEFDYVARINSSTYCNKKQLIKYAQLWPDNNMAAGIEVAATDKHEKWLWGPQIIFSRDVVQKIVDNKDKYDHSKMEDTGISNLINQLNIPYYTGSMCSIDKEGASWRCLCYGMGESFNFSAWEDVKKAGEHYFYRVKYDLDRTVDKFIMERLYEHLI